MKIKNASAYKDQYLKRKTNGFIYKFIAFSDNLLENEKRFDSLKNNSLWFGCPWTMNDPTEFLIPVDDKDFTSSEEKMLFDIQMSCLYEMYNLCSFSQVNDNYMWEEYGNKGNGFCLQFRVDDFDWFYPVEYVDDKESYSYINLWRIANNAISKIKGELPNLALGYLPYVIKDKINKSTGKSSEKEQEIRAIYCIYSDDEENGGMLVPGYKKANNIMGNNVDWHMLKMRLYKIEIGEKCRNEYKEKLKNIARDMGVECSFKKT